MLNFNEKSGTSLFILDFNMTNSSKSAGDHCIKPITEVDDILFQKERSPAMPTLVFFSNFRKHFAYFDA